MLATLETIILVYYVNGKGIMNVACTKAQLFHLEGMEVHDILADLQDPGPVNTEANDVFSVCLRKLDPHF